MHTYENGVQFEIKSSSFVIPEDIISVNVEQDFTNNATGMVLE